MVKNKIKIGILGCSSIAERQVIPAIKLSDRFELIAVASRSKEKSEVFSKKFNCLNCSYENLISDIQIDAIYLSLPVNLHYYWGLKIISAGKHLLMEKPFTHSIQTTKKIIAEAKKKKIIAFEVLPYFFHPSYQTIVSQIEKGSIGKIKHIEANFGFPFPPSDNFRYKMELGGGSLLDSMIYPLSFCLNIAGESIKKIKYILKYNKQIGIDTGGVFLLEFEDISATINYGFGYMYRNNYLIWGSQGYLYGERVFTRPAELSGKITITKQDSENNIFYPAANQFLLMLKSFADRIHGKSKEKYNENSAIIERMQIISKFSKIIYKELKIPRNDT